MGGEHEIKFKIADLGVSKQVGDLLEECMSTVGTPIYSAPEILDRNYTNKIDVWSLGIIFYQMLTDELPFQGANQDALRQKRDEGKILLPIKELNLS